jgi:cyclophilin family peptidyl-prolyl cis-trans isomerase
MGRKNLSFLVTLTLLATVLFSGMESRAETIVQFNTSLGLSFQVELFDSAAPLTVANFLNYVNDGDFANSIIHRRAANFVLQGGGFTLNNNDEVVQIPTNAPVVNEFNQSNRSGTIAMAKLGGDPDSATNQWFFNLADNGANLDNQNGGFTVFGQVLGNGMDIVDAIAALPSANISSTPLRRNPPLADIPPFPSQLIDVVFNPANIEGAFQSTPLFNYDQTNADNGDHITNENLVFITEITHMPEPGTLGLLAIGWLGVARRRRRIA